MTQERERSCNKNYTAQLHDNPIQQSQRRQKIKVFPQRTYIIWPTWPKILHIKPQLSLFYNKRNFWNISTLKRVWLSEVLQKHQSPIMYLFIFIHSLMSENDKNVPSIIRDFRTKWGKTDTHSLLKRRDLKVSYLKFWVLGLLGENFTFFSSLGTTKIPGVWDALYILMLFFWWTFQNNLNYAYSSNIREVIKFYNLGDKFLKQTFVIYSVVKKTEDKNVVMRQI